MRINGGVFCTQRMWRTKVKIQPNIDGVCHGRHYFAGGFGRCHFDIFV